jgi:hypothetical protein
MRNFNLWPLYQQGPALRKPPTAQVAPLLFQIVERVLFKDSMSLEEPVQPRAGFEAQQAAELGLGDMPALEFFQGEHFQDLAREITMFRGEVAGETRREFGSSGPCPYPTPGGGMGSTEYEWKHGSVLTKKRGTAFFEKINIVLVGDPACELTILPLTSPWKVTGLLLKLCI